LDIKTKNQKIHKPVKEKKKSKKNEDKFGNFKGEEQFCSQETADFGKKILKRKRIKNKNLIEDNMPQSSIDSEESDTFIIPQKKDV